MAADSTSLKAQIDAALSGKGYRGITVLAVVTILKAVADWVTNAINANLTTWLKVSDGQPGGANADSIFRTGLTEFRGGAILKTRTATNAPLKALVIGDTFALQLMAINGGPAFMEFHLPGSRIDQLGVDTDGVLKVRPWTSSKSYPIVISGLTESLGLGTDPAQNTGIDLASGWATFRGNVGGKLPGNGIGISLGWNFSSGGAENTIAYGIRDWPNSYLSICSFDGIAMVERMRISADGKVGMGTSAPSSRLHVSGANGYEQFRLEKSFTPSSTSDSRGQVGELTADDNYIYRKTSTGWKRSALSTF